MTTATWAPKKGTVSDPFSLDDLVQGLGGIPLSRILAKPAPGTATESDVLESQRIHNRLYELVDGVLVEKAMGLSESFLGSSIEPLPEELRHSAKPWYCHGGRRRCPPFSGSDPDSRCCVCLVGPIPRSQDPIGTDPITGSRPCDRSLESSRTPCPRWNASVASFSRPA